jgi:ribonuclease P protein component
VLNNFRFSKKKRLLAKAQFQRVFGQKKRLYSPYFLAYHANNDESYARMGIITSKRCAKQANQRNHIRRQVRERFRQHPFSIQSADIIVIAHHSAAQADNKEIQQCLDKLFERLERVYRAP